jgi:ABC-type nitrate/sulfonate/bicarbonate transport system permease component
MIAAPVTPRPPRGTPLWLGGLLPLLVVVAWFAATSVCHRFPPHQVPSPGEVSAAAWQLAEDGELSRHVLASLSRVLAGFALGASLAAMAGTHGDATAANRWTPHAIGAFHDAGVAHEP